MHDLYIIEIYNDLLVENLHFLLFLLTLVSFKTLTNEVLLGLRV